MKLYWDRIENTWNIYFIQNYMDGWCENQKTVARKFN